MKKGIIALLPLALTVAIFMGLSLACASSPSYTSSDAYGPETTLYAENLQEFVQDYEITQQTESSLTPSEFIDVIKRAFKYGAVKDAKLAYTNSKLSYAIIESPIDIDGYPFTFRFNYAIDSEGLLTMQVSSLTEVEPVAEETTTEGDFSTETTTEETTFEKQYYKKTIKESKVATYRNEVRDKIAKRMKEISKVVFE